MSYEIKMEVTNEGSVVLTTEDRKLARSAAKLAEAFPKQLLVEVTKSVAPQPVKFR